MQYVPENQFVELLNAELVKDPEGAYLPPFTLGPQGFSWPHKDAKTDLIYLHVANHVRESYGIYH